MVLPKIATQRQTLGDSVYRYLRDEIITLRLFPGQMVYENELAKSLGVSRTPVREAFRLLHSEEFIEILPQRGIRIAYISRRKIEEAWFVRESLEVSAFKFVARNWRPADERCKKLQEQVLQILEEQKKAAKEQNYFEFNRLDLMFHHNILEFAGNGTLLSVIRQMHGHLKRMIGLELKETKHTVQLVYDHEAIFNAMISGDESMTETLLTAHFRRLLDHVPVIMSIYPEYFRQD
jgi:DNA-binding GntR family transcriptional regulator